MKKLILGALCALFFIACGDSPEDILKKEVEFQEKWRNLTGVTQKKFALQKCRDGLGLACDYGASGEPIVDDITFELNQRACDSDYSSKNKPDYCEKVAGAYRKGNIVKEDTDKTLEYRKKACELGMRDWCEFLYDVYSGNLSNYSEKIKKAFEKYKNPAEAEKYKEKIK